MGGTGATRPPRPRWRLPAWRLLQVWVALLLLIPAALVFKPLGAAGSPAQVLGLGALAWWVAAQLVRSRPTQRVAQPVRGAMLVFVLAILLSYVAAMSRPIEALEKSAADRGILIVLSWLGILLMASDGLRTRAGIDAVLRLAVAASAVSAAVGVAQFITHQPIIDVIQIPGLTPNGTLTSIYDRNGFARAAGTATHPIEFGVMLAMMLPVALHYALAKDGRSALRRWTPVVAVAAAVPISMSRSTLLGLGLALVIVLPTWPVARRRIAYAYIAVGGVLVYASVPGLLGTMSRLFTGISADDSALSRVDSLEIAVRYAAQHPFTGRGFATFLPNYRILDNQYLGLLVETGVVGVGALLGLLATGIVVASRIRRSPRDPLDASLATSLTASVAVAAMACATFDALGFPQVAGMLVLSLGCIAALARHNGVGARQHRAAPRVVTA